MDWEQIKRNWKEVCDKTKRAWENPSEDDLTAIAGQRDLFAGMRQERYGYDRVVAVNARSVCELMKLEIPVD